MTLANVTVVQLEYLRAALRAPTWSAAASEVGVSPSAFSQGIAELERRLGVVLFERSGRLRTPTAAADEALDHANRILGDVAQLTRWADRMREGESGRINVGMIDTAAVHHFGDVLAAHRSAHPDVQLRLTVEPSVVLQERLLAGDLDLIVCVAPEPDPTLTIVPVIDEPLFVYAPPGVVVGNVSTWGPWVGFPTESRTRGVIGRALRARGIEYAVVAESSQPAVVREMVRLGMGWTVLSAVDAEAQPHALARAHPEPVTERTLAIVQRVDRSVSPALRRLVDELHVAAADATDGQRARR